MLGTSNTTYNTKMSIDISGKKRGGGAGFSKILHLFNLCYTQKCLKWTLNIKCYVNMVRYATTHYWAITLFCLTLAYYIQLNFYLFIYTAPNHNRFHFKPLYKKIHCNLIITDHCQLHRIICYFPLYWFS